VEQFLSSCRLILEKLVSEPEAKLSEFKIDDALIKQAESARQRKRELTIAIAATFTAEPIEESVRCWLEELEIPARIEFAPFNQVFQQLLDPASSISTNVQGLNAILVRLEDWLPKMTGADPARELERSASEFIS